MNLSKKLTIEDAKFDGKRIFCRCDFNVPLDDKQAITDTTRITASLQTIKKILELKPKRLVLCSHLGRPKGQKKDKLSLKPVANKLTELLNRPVTLISNWFENNEIEKEITSKCDGGGIVLLENVRFYIEEEGKGQNEKGEKVKANPENVTKFQKVLTSMTDIFVNDAFGTCHRAHSSMVFDAPVRVAGLLLEKEIKYFNQALSNTKRPYLAILGGAKVSDKIQVIANLLDRVDQMIIAGGMCFTFLKVLKNMEIGKSLYDEDGAKIVKDLVDKAKQKNVEFILPNDFVCGDKFDADSTVSTTTIEKGIVNGCMGLDIGQESIKTFKKKIVAAKTIVWNGPPGVFEFKNFEVGTKAMVDAMVEATGKGCVTIVGGGDSAAACAKYGAAQKVSHVSTGGGASLELLEGKLLPGIVALSDK